MNDTRTEEGVDLIHGGAIGYMTLREYGSTMWNKALAYLVWYLRWEILDEMLLKSCMPYETLNS